MPTDKSTGTSSKESRSFTIGIAVLTTVGVVAAGAYGASAALGIVSPTTVVELLTRPASDYGKLFPSRAIAVAERPRLLGSTAGPMPLQIPWYGGSLSIDEFLATTHANAFVVLRKGQPTREWYRDGFGPTTQQPSYSVAKSVVSLLVGIAIEKGVLREDELLVDVLPELRHGTPYDAITVRDLLDMASGVDVSENYSPWNPLTGTAGMMLSTDLDEFIRSHRDMSFQPGSKADYRSVDTQLLGAVVARSEGKTLSELLGSELWEPIGAQDPAIWSLDRPGGTEKAFCCINASARDFAKIGQLVLDTGKVGDKQVVPAAWITRIRKPVRQLVDPPWGYSAQWWHPTGSDRGDFSAVGIYGQYIYVDPRTETVIVKLSDHGVEQDEQATIDAFRSIADSRT